MLKLIKRLLKDNTFYLALFITIAITILSLIKVGKQPINFKYLDKVEHAIAYFVLTFLWIYSFRNRNHKFILLILALCVFFGVLMEFLQANLTSYRTFDYADMLANTFGALLAYFLFEMLKKMKQYVK